MLEQIVWAVMLTLVTVGIHGGCTVILIHRLASHRSHPQGHARTLSVHSLRFGRIVVFLLLAHFAEASVWAVFYANYNGFPSFEPSLYFSLTSYSTIGYGDLLLPQSLRIVGVMEGLVGTFMCGWSVALLVALLQDVLRADGLSPRHEGNGKGVGGTL